MAQRILKVIKRILFNILKYIDFINDNFFNSNKLNSVNRSYGKKDSAVSNSEHNKTLDLKNNSVEENNFFYDQGKYFFFF